MTYGPLLLTLLNFIPSSAFSENTLLNASGRYQVLALQTEARISKAVEFWAHQIMSRDSTRFLSTMYWQSVKIDFKHKNEVIVLLGFAC